MGKGRAGCRCCNAACCVPATLVIVGLVGIALVGGGIGVLIGGPKSRASAIKRIDKAVAAWNDPTAATGWRQFQQLNASVSMAASSSFVGGFDCQSASQSLALVPSKCPTDQYLDEGGRFQSVKQLALCATFDWYLMQICGMQVSFQMLQPGSNSLATLTNMSNPVTPVAGAVTIKTNQISGPNKCGAGKNCNQQTCTKSCLNTFGGGYDCSRRTCSTIRTYVSSLAIKVQYKPAASPSFSVDTVNPAMGSSGGGANVLTSGYSWTKSTTGAYYKGPAWVYEGLSYAFAPSTVTFMIRSSSDPWLTYMAETEGSGSFGISRKAVTGIGAAMIAIGALCWLCVLLIGLCVCWGKKLARESPNEKPNGCVKGIAWGWGRMMLNPQPQAAYGVSVPMANVAQPPSDYYYPPQGTPPPPGTAPPGGYYPYPPAPGGAYPPGAAAAQPQTDAYGSPYYPPPQGGAPQQPGPYGAPPAGYPSNQFAQGDYPPTKH